jgi:polysaccharide transporter, PST family
MNFLIQKLFRKETVIASAGFVFLFTIMEKVITLVRGVIFARMLGPAEYGTYTLAFIIIPLITPLARLGLPSCYERYIPQYEKKGELKDFLQRNYLLTIGTAFVITILLFPFSKNISLLLYSTAEHKNIIVLCLMSIIPIVLYENILASFNGLRIFKMSSLLKINQIFIFSVIGILLVILYPKALSVVAASLLSYVLVSIVFVIMIWKYVLNAESPSLKVQENKFIKKMFKYSIWFIITPLFSSLFNYTDRLVLNHFLGLQEVGVYSAAVNISQLVFMFGMITGNVLMPNLSSMWEKGEKDRVMFILNLAIKFTILLILSYSVAFVLFKKEIISILYGSKYIEAIPLIPFLLLFWLNSSLVWLIGVYPNLIEKPYIPLFAAVPGFILNVSLNYLLIPIYGIKGAAIATLCAQIFMLTVLLILYRREKMKINVNTVVVCFAPFVLLLNNFAMITIFILLLAATVRGEFIMNKEEKDMLIRQISKLYVKLSNKESN